MKLKNSFVLIAIAIFLLISIGSVCASENVTSDSDVQSADDGTDVVLSSDSDTDENVADENTNQDLTNTTTIPEKEKYEFKEDSANKTISVQVKDNKTGNYIDVNKNELALMNGNKNISFEYNATLIKITETLPVGNYNLTINYLGNAQYNTSYAIVAVKIFGNNTIETETSVVCNGKDIIVPVKVFDQVEYIELVKNNFNLTLVYTNETGNVTNLTISDFDLERKDENNSYTIKFTTEVKLISASLIMNYANATEPKTVGIKVSTEVKAETDKDKFKSEEIKNISITIKDGQGNLLNVSKNDLKVLDNGNEITNFNYTNSNITFELKAEGKHNITILYKGNESYNASNTTIEIGVYGANQIKVPELVVSDDGKKVEIPITIFNGLENITIDKNNLTLNLTYTNETGNINTVAVTGFDIEDGKIIIGNIGYPLTKASLTIDYVNSTGAKTVKVNLLTIVDATSASEKYRYNETNNITVKVFDYAGNQLNITAKNLTVLDNGKNIQFTLVNTTMNVVLTEGVHNLTIIYKGDETYNSSNKTIVLKVYGDLRIEPSPSIILDEDENATIFINLNDGADLVEIDQTKLSITIFYTSGNKTYNRTVTGFTLNGQNVTFKLEENIDSAYVDIKYDTNLTGKTDVKVNTVITCNDTLTYGESEVKNFTIEVKGTNGHALNLTDKNIQVLKDGKALNIAVNGSVVTINDVLKFGLYNLTIKYLGTATYLESNKTVVLSIYGINATSKASINSTLKGEIKFDIINGNETLNIIAKDLKVNLTYKNGNDTIIIPCTVDKIMNGTLFFTVGEGNFTSAILNIKYNNTEINITLNRVYNVKVEAINSVVEYQSGKLIYKLTDVDTNEALANRTVDLEYRIVTGQITVSGVSGSGITIISTISNKTDENGILTVDNNKMNGQGWGFMDAGNTTVTIKSGAFNKTIGNSQNITINKATINIKIDNYKEYYGSEKKIKITVTNVATGDPVKNTILHLYLPVTTQKDYYFQTNENGTSEINVNGFVGGTYDLTVSNNDTKNINNRSTKGSFTILKIPVTLTAKDVTVYYNSGVTQTIKVTKNGKAVSGMYVLLRIYSTSKKYNDYLFQTNKQGKIPYSASLAVGKHKVIIASADNRYNFKQATKTITVKKASAKITAKKLNTYYKGGKYFTVKLTNTKTKKAIYDAKLNIKLFISKTRYYNYNGKTAMNGQIRLSLDQLKPGSYKVVIAGKDNKNYAAKEVTSKIVIKKTPAKLTPKKLTAKKGAKKFFKVTVKNKKTKKAISGVKLKVKVYTGKKAKTFTAKTNAKGIAKISTAKLKVGKHKVVVASANKHVVAKKAKSTIKIKK